MQQRQAEMGSSNLCPIIQSLSTLDVLLGFIDGDVWGGSG